MCRDFGGVGRGGVQSQGSKSEERGYKSGNEGEQVGKTSNWAPPKDKRN